MVLTSLKSPDEVIDQSALLPREKYFVQQKPIRSSRVEDVPVQVVDDPAVPAGQVKVRVIGGGERVVARGDLVSRRWVWDNYRKAWNRIEPPFTTYFWNSLLTAGLATLGIGSQASKRCASAKSCLSKSERTRPWCTRHR
ncbi:MAG: hypothetical protein U5M53_12920 [Rhodoferax sp.]|nr:hypothetical protein [Rhodoferax sp.]